MQSQILLFDSFAYNGEPIAELRLEYLERHVDQFIMVEAQYTHSGVRKEQLYCDKYKHIFAPLVQSGKMAVIVIDEFPPMPEDWPTTHCEVYMNDASYESWFREQYQRDIVAQYLKQHYKDREYLVICSDVDEIVSADMVAGLRKQYFAFGEPVYVEMKFYYYNFSWQKKHPWYKAFVVNDLAIQRQTLSHYRNRKNASHIIQGGGWHASYFLNGSGLKEKLASFAHRECDQNDRKTDEHFRACFHSGVDIALRGTEDDCVKSDVSKLPLLFQEFQKKMLFLQTYS